MANKGTSRGQEYVVYVVAVVSMKVKTDTKDEAAKFGQGQVMKLLAGVDRNVYVPRIAVMEADDDEDQKANLANGIVPWLDENK